jgi:hypothetical protein
MTAQLSSTARPWHIALLVALCSATPAAATPSAIDGELVAKLQSIEASRRALRKEALKDAQSWAEQRAARASEHRRRIAELWGSVVGIIDAQASLRMNADRMARLNRMLDLAEAKGDAALVARLQVDVTRELTRHARAMQRVSALSGSQ